MRHVVNFSFGESSWATAKIVVQKYGAENVILLFADVRNEDEDTYAWGEAAAANVGARLVRIADGRTPWDVFFDEGMMGSTRADLCSRILKRELLDKWYIENCDPSDVTRYIGLNSEEADRFCRWDAKGKRWRGALHSFAERGWLVRAPLCERGTMLSAGEVSAWREREGLWQQRLYREGFPHANCGGECVKQGQTGWLHLLKMRPAAFAKNEANEQEFRRRTGKDVAILRDRSGGTTKPLTLKELRERHEAGREMPLFDWGGCSCFSGSE